MEFSILDTYDHYELPYLSIDLYHSFISDNSCKKLQESIMTYGKFPHPHITKKGILSKRRNKIIYGDIPFYKINYKGIEINTKVYPWSDLPVLQTIRDKITELTGQSYEVCVIQLYNSGEVGIDPHRDKEMKSGTIIASLSLGTTRIMRFDRGHQHLEIELSAGTLCLLQPPTNDYWLHSIPKDSSTGTRLSLVFRHV
jgi:alkylated DNA repair dioxygenase AlkB